MNIKYLDLKAVTAIHGDEIQQAVDAVVRGGWYLQGEANGRFEQHYAEYNGNRFCVGCANGLDALTLTFRTLMEMGMMREGDEVIVPANTYIASMLSVTENRLKAVLVEPRFETLQIDDSLVEASITSRTRAILLVNLYGRNAYSDKIGEICNRHNLALVVDNAQGHGINNLSPLPSFLSPLIVCHSFYPGKNLGALGDAGAITTDDERFANIFRSLANYGSSRKYVFDYCGRNSRLDEIQAAVLDVKLPYLNAENKRRRDIAMRYIKEVSNPNLSLPTIDYWQQSVFHIFPVFTTHRDLLQQYLSDNGVQTVIHYPIPPHRQQCYVDSPLLALPDGGLSITERIHREELSIPCNPTLSDNEVSDIVSLLNSFSL
ncbi:MAG: DegT/DnrJ/EryC1/StrS family aminotransferase [Prevotella sp.]